MGMSRPRESGRQLRLHCRHDLPYRAKHVYRQHGGGGGRRCKGNSMQSAGGDSEMDLQRSRSSLDK